MPTRFNRWFLLQILLLAQHVSGTIIPIIRSSSVLYKWLLPVVFGAWFSSCRYGVELRVVCLVCGLFRSRALMMGIMVPETCWASNKICNKNHLLHLVGILFPRMNDCSLLNNEYNGVASIQIHKDQILILVCNGKGTVTFILKYKHCAVEGYRKVGDIHLCIPEVCTRYWLVISLTFWPFYTLAKSLFRTVLVQ